MPNLQHISDAVWCFFGSWQPASLFTFIIKKGHYMDHFHISKVLRSESHHSWVNLYRGDSDRVWNDMRMSKWWLNFIFGCNFQPHAESHTPPVHGKALAWSAWHAPVGVASFSVSWLRPLPKTSRLPLAWRRFDPRLVSCRICWQLLSSALSELWLQFRQSELGQGQR